KLSCLTSTKLKLFILESNPRRYPHANVIPYVNEIYSPSLVSDALPLSLADETNPILLNSKRSISRNNTTNNNKLEEKRVSTTATSATIEKKGKLNQKESKEEEEKRSTSESTHTTQQQKEQKEQKEKQKELQEEPQEDLQEGPQQRQPITVSDALFGNVKFPPKNINRERQDKHRSRLSTTDSLQEDLEIPDNLPDHNSDIG
ncbi:18700_t:CDS:2, partial [Entrophospora sp. SA101]